MSIRSWIAALAIPIIALGANGVRAQDAAPPDPGAEPPSDGGDAPNGGGQTVIQVPYAPPGAGAAQPGADVNSGLGAGDRPATAGNVGKDGFDLQAGGKFGADTIRGGQNSSYVVSGQVVPELHTARRGDTLWDISSRYFGNPYNWPRIWSYNRQVQNPHWIYPGDHLRLREPFVQQSGIAAGIRRLNPEVSPTTKFHRHLGFVLDDKTPAWGDVVGSPDDQMILSQEDEIYIQLYGEREYQVGQKLIVFEPRAVKGRSDYPLVWIRGIAQIDRYNAKTKMARARLIESFSEIHRGCKVAPYERNLDVVAPVRNKKTLQARITGALHPFVYYAQNQVVFIDKGSQDGLEVGNRLFVVERADRWRSDLGGSGSLTDRRSTVEDDEQAKDEEPPDEVDPDAYPTETYGELIVLRVRKRTATCLITASAYEISRGAALIAREGY